MWLLKVTCFPTVLFVCIFFSTMGGFCSFWTRYSMDCGSDLPQSPPPPQGSEWIMDRTLTKTSPPPPPPGTLGCNSKITKYTPNHCKIPFWPPHESMLTIPYLF